MSTRIQSEYRGVGFELWRARDSWRWMLRLRERAAAIGIARSETDALREACHTIEELPEIPARAPEESCAMRDEIMWTIALACFALRGGAGSRQPTPTHA